VSFTSRFSRISLKGNHAELGEPPGTLPTVGTNLTDIVVHKIKIIVRELGGCMGPIWPSYYRDCCSVIFMVDAANTTQVSSSCIQLLSVLSAEALETTSVLILFHKYFVLCTFSDIPCPMSLVEMKSLFRLDDIICARQPITVLGISARNGQGLQDVQKWLHSIQK
ncbi:ADP-ribosylation factor-like protein 16 isoform X1, partial [Acipenser oxyrinchus oxyrinchus]